MYVHDRELQEWTRGHGHSFCGNNPMNNFLFVIIYLQFYKLFYKEPYPEIYGTIFFFLFLENTFHTYIMLQYVPHVWHLDTCKQITAWMLTTQAQYSGRSKSNIRATIRLKASVQLMLQ
jgi:hypothetical protein